MVLYGMIATINWILDKYYGQSDSKFRGWRRRTKKKTENHKNSSDNMEMVTRILNNSARWTVIACVCIWVCVCVCCDGDDEKHGMTKQQYMRHTKITWLMMINRLQANSFAIWLSPLEQSTGKQTWRKKKKRMIKKNTTANRNRNRLFAVQNIFASLWIIIIIIIWMHTQLEKICLCMSMSILELNYTRKPLNSCVFWYVLCG